GSTAMLRGFWALRTVDPGFDPQHLLTFELSLPVRDYRAYGDAARFYVELTERIRSLPGVRHAEAVSTLPLTETPAWSVVPVAIRESEPGPDDLLPRATTNL